MAILYTVKEVRVRLNDAEDTLTVDTYFEINNDGVITNEWRTQDWDATTAGGIDFQADWDDATGGTAADAPP